MKLDDTFTRLLTQNMRLGQIPFMRGRAGIGKTSISQQAAENLGSEAFTLAVNLIAVKEDLSGARLIKNDAGEYVQAFFPHEDLNLAIDYALEHPDETPVLILDEINRTSGDVTSATLGIMTERKIGRRHLPKNLLIVVTGNGEGNVSSLDEASLSRFVVYDVEADAPSWLAYMGDGLNHWIRQIIENDNDLINGEPAMLDITAERDQDADDDEPYIEASFAEAFNGAEAKQITTPRTLSYLSAWLGDCSNEELAGYLATPSTIKNRTATMLDEIIQGYVGDTTFARNLVAAMAADLGGTSMQSSSTQLTQPASYNQLMQATSVTQLINTITTMTEDERADALLWALRDQRDSSRFIGPLAENVDSLGDERNRTLLELANNQSLDSENVRAFLESGTDLGEHYDQYLSAFA